MSHELKPLALTSAALTEQTSSVEFQASVYSRPIGPDFQPDRLPRPEYPRPDFRRGEDSWLNLNGRWEFAYDDDNTGRAAGWQQLPHLPGQLEITVPFAFQSQLSGLGDPSFHDHIWYAREFELSPTWLDKANYFKLHFGAVDYYCQVWLNGQLIGQHTGGHVPFSFEVGDRLKRGEPNRLVLYVEDTQDKTQPRGKQYWQEVSDFCFYTRTSGIWQTVWLEALPDHYLDHLQVQTDIDQAELDFTLKIAGSSLDADQAQATYTLGVKVSLGGELVEQAELDLAGKVGSGSGGALQIADQIKLPQLRLWSPEDPCLYDLELTLYRDRQPVDQVQSYFGMRKISISNGRVLLNNQPYYLRLILDQGYFPDGLLTAPTDEALWHDIELIKAFGFNGARKHQKIEDPRWLYWADQLGLLVWDEMPSAYQWHVEAEHLLIEEWLEVIGRDYNHPCVITWVPFNESWGLEGLSHNLQQQEFVKRVVALTRAMDSTRLVIDNDGWEHQDGTSDLITIHDYTAEGTALFERYTPFVRDNQTEHLPLVSDRPVLLPGSLYRGEPILFTEFGGISLMKADQLPVEAVLGGDWGYSNASDSARLVEQYAGLIENLVQLGFSSGFCYTQLTDVEQEVNGLLTYDRRPKVDPAAIAEHNRRLI